MGYEDNRLNIIHNINIYSIILVKAFVILNLAAIMKATIPAAAHNCIHIVKVNVRQG